MLLSSELGEHTLCQLLTHVFCMPAAAELEQRRMTYGQDKHGVPKGLTEDAGFLGERCKCATFGVDFAI